MKAILRSIALCALMVASSAAAAQDYPSGPMRLVVPFPPGGGADILGRALADKLGQTWGQQILVENRAGAGGTLGAANVAKSAPDGHTMLLVPNSFAVNPSLYTDLPFDSLVDLQPVTQLASLPLVVTVHPSLPVKTMAELIELAKSRPGEINYASAGNGSPPHLATEQLKYMTGVDMVHVPYQGGAPALLANVSGEVPVYIQSLNSAMPYVKDGRLRALAVTSAERFPSVPEIPTIGETVPGYKSDNWYGLFVTGSTPEAIYSKLNKEVVRIMNEPELSTRMANEGAKVVGSTPEQFKEFLVETMATYAEIVKATGMKLD